jgi:glycosyltransferase involved in cell wall biosynthesis
VSKYQIDIIHTDGPRNTFYAGIVAKLKRIPLIWHVRASNQDRFDRLLYNLSSKIILVADALRSRFITNGNDKKFVTIHNGVDLSKFRPKEPEKYVREKYYIGNNEILISVTARIERLKGQKYLIEACGKIKKKIKDFHILLAGEIVDFSYLRECQDKADEFGIKDRVIFAGQLENVSQILNASDIFVLPSLFEAFPRSVIEAMATGKPVIATNVGGCSEAFEDKISGFLVPARASGALADKILLLAKNRNLREKIGNEARYRVEKMFEIGDKVKQIEKLYYEVL